MKIRILGAHNCESKTTRLTSLLVDGVLAMDAGGLTSSLTLPEQLSLKALLITHPHYDHIRDIPALGMNFFIEQRTIPVYSTLSVYDTLHAFLLNNVLYPNFMIRPSEQPTVKFTVLRHLLPVEIEGYNALPVPMHHSLPDVGYLVTSKEGKSMFFTGDTGPGLAECWQHVSPQLLVIEVSAPDRLYTNAIQNGHLTPLFLEQELTSFRQIHGYLPQVVAVHITPQMEDEIKKELEGVTGRLGHPIALGYEGMEIEI